MPHAACMRALPLRCPTLNAPGFPVMSHPMASAPCLPRHLSAACSTQVGPATQVLATCSSAPQGLTHPAGPCALHASQQPLLRAHNPGGEQACQPCTLPLLFPNCPAAPCPPRCGLSAATRAPGVHCLKKYDCGHSHTVSSVTAQRAEIEAGVHATVCQPQHLLVQGLTPAAPGFPRMATT